MINTYLLTMEEVEALVLSLDKYYGLSFTNLGQSAGVGVISSYDVSKQFLGLRHPRDHRRRLLLSPVGYSIELDGHWKRILPLGR